ncbi:preprotein translocase subunit SecE [Actinobacillus succinogenes]|uniref:Protein translocase subunit SecE n=1 Tax=Actinobacillus succinogenes (strain ATCC 55618 / DSM 22257 / CCUG 43843 / 130Z) TaxID=339671 RepID=A6VKD2_ACTSZ|nr:preprotein translocase subunit SecE [Actinobacillus succinogenes]ABR73429.1 preprotein translocase, SecE subunit [Actinobacillus succinogenes 130Z]PHI40108.1 preprotein translocase subunit SecE [Actinobacillus succinogenes]
MALVVEKKKNEVEQTAQKSKGLNGFLWFLVVAFILVASVGNIYFAEQYSTPVRVVAMFVLIAIALILAAMTNQGKKALAFFSEARTELRRVTWPTRPEATQTTFIVVAVTVVTSLILWGFDSVIVSVLNFLTDLRF